MQVAWWTAAGLGAAIAGAYACSALVIGCARKKPERVVVSSSSQINSSAAKQETRAQPQPTIIEPMYDPITLLKGHTAGVVGLAWSLDGKTLASISTDRTLRLWAAEEESLRARDHVVRLVNIKLETPIQVLFTVDGKVLLALENGKLRRLALLNERGADNAWVKLEVEFDLNHKDALRSICSLPAGELLSCSSGTVVRLHSATGVEIASYDTHQVECYGVAASADGRYLAAASWSADVNVLALDAAKGKAPRIVPAFVLPGHRRAVRAVAFSPQDRVVTASADGTARLYRLRRPGEDPVLITSLPVSSGSGGVFQVAQFSPDGSVLLLCEGRSIVCVNAEDGAIMKRWTAHEANVVAVSFSPDSKFIASAADGEKSVKIWRSP